MRFDLLRFPESTNLKGLLHKNVPIAALAPPKALNYVASLSS